MTPNVGGRDRAIRIAIGLVILIPHYAWYLLRGEYCVWSNIGWLPLLTGIFRFCPAYLPFGISSCRKP